MSSHKKGRSVAWASARIKSMTARTFLPDQMHSFLAIAVQKSSIGDPQSIVPTSSTNHSEALSDSSLPSLTR